MFRSSMGWIPKRRKKVRCPASAEQWLKKQVVCYLLVETHGNECPADEMNPSTTTGGRGRGAESEPGNSGYLHTAEGGQCPQRVGEMMSVHLQARSIVLILSCRA